MAEARRTTKLRRFDHTEAELEKWYQKGRKAYVKAPLDQIRTNVADIERILPGLAERMRDPANADWKWYRGQHLILTGRLRAAKERLHASLDEIAVRPGYRKDA